MNHSVTGVKPHIVVVDDDAAIRQLVGDYLVQHDFRVTCLGDGDGLGEILAREAVDLLILDIKLPGDDGLTLARRLRQHSTIPIIMLTGLKDEVDRVIGLELGADDYLTKPFSPRELLARIKAILRRVAPPPEVVAKPSVGQRAYRFGGFELNLATRRLSTPSGDEIILTVGEFNLLCAFLRAPLRVLSRDQLLELSRLHSDEVFDRSIDVQILRLRRKLETNPREPRLIVTERGMGYRFAVPVQAL